MKGKIQIKRADDIEVMAEGGKKLGRIRAETARAVKPGMTTAEVDAIADKLITESGGEASFKRVPGYRHATCINLNNVVVHGIPDNTIIKEGDKVGIDVGLYYRGWHTDAAVTIRAGGIKDPEMEKFLSVGRTGLKKAIAQAKPGKRVWDISRAMQETVEEAGYSAVRALTGHGVGRELHEPPHIPCFAAGEKEYSPKLTEGMVIAIEIMYNLGTFEVAYINDDGWTIGTADGKISGLFEESVAVTSRGPVILTASTR